MDEIPIQFDCCEATLLGVLHQPQNAGCIGVIVVVGGPQYRVGSHRQFVLLARRLAGEGIPVFRFDYRGMGDSDGPSVGFEQVTPDIKAAIDIFYQESPQLERVVLWGLCDAASAIMMYALEKDKRVIGNILLNPWVRTDVGIAKVYLKTYYVRRILDRNFWRKVVRGEYPLTKGLSDIVSLARTAFRRKPADRKGVDSQPQHFTEQMLIGMTQFPGSSLFILSGNDMTADEFRQTLANSRPWQNVMEGKLAKRKTLPSANHTFSSEAWREQVAEWSIEWVRELQIPLS